jgi:hypothetical protein
MKTDPSKLSDEERRVAIARACGWKPIRASKQSRGFASDVMETPESTPKNFRATFLPDYLNDLNAMAAAEATLTNEQQDEYAHHLSQIIPQRFNCGPAFPNDPSEPDIMTHREFDLLSATATQRAEAFLLTIAPTA